MQPLHSLLNNDKLVELFNEAVEVLKALISIPSLSKQEEHTANFIEQFLKQKNIATQRHINNVWATNKFYNDQLPTILLNSHHDTVKPNAGYTLNPFEAIIQDEKLFGLGSNDAGGALVSLLACFLFFYEAKNLKYNIIFAATAEEEISGENGIASILPKLGAIDFALVGEPTEMNLAIAEKGLLVLDCEAQGTASHAAHENNNQAILNSIKDIQWFNSFKFPKQSSLLGDIKMAVTIINAGTQHNIIPSSCHFTVDIRTTEAYSNKEVFDMVCKNISSKATARSFKLNSSYIPLNHPIVQAGLSLGKKTYGSPTISDMALMHFPSLKMGPGNSLRSHASNEFIFIKEIKDGIETYIQLLSKIITI